MTTETGIFSGQFIYKCAIIKFINRDRYSIKILSSGYEYEDTSIDSVDFFVDPKLKWKVDIIDYPLYYLYSKMLIHKNLSLSCPKQPFCKIFNFNTSYLEYFLTISLNDSFKDNNNNVFVIVYDNNSIEKFLTILLKKKIDISNTQSLMMSLHSLKENDLVIEFENFFNTNNMLIKGYTTKIRYLNILNYLDSKIHSKR